MSARLMRRAAWAALGVVVALLLLPLLAWAQAPAPATPPAPAPATPVAPPPATWVKCADENGTCARTETSRREVRYGAGTGWASRVVDLGVIPCTNQVFGDPAVGVRKACWYDNADTTAPLSAPLPVPVVPPSPPVPPPAVPPVPAPVLPDPVPVVTAVGPPPPPVLCWPSVVLGVPVPGATGSQLYWGAVGDIGDWYGWRCPSLDAGGTPVAAGNTYAVVKMVRRSYKGQALSTLVNEALHYPRLIDALAAMWHKYDVPCESMAADLQPACVADLQALAAAALAALSPPPPPPPTAATWAVAPYALSKTTPPTRPVFGFRAGRRVAQTYTQAEVGQPCRPEVAGVVEGAVQYAAFGPAFNPLEVTVCVRK